MLVQALTFAAPMLEPIYHTRLGGAVAHLICASAWLLGFFLIGLTCAYTMAHTYGISCLLTMSIFMESEFARQTLTRVVCLACIYMGPSWDLDGSYMYWASTCFFVAMDMLTSCGRFREQPGFKKLLRDLDYTKYYSACELRGALEDIQKKQSVFAFHPHGLFCLGFNWNGCWSEKFEHLAGKTMWLVARPIRTGIFARVLCDWHGTIETLDKHTFPMYMRRNVNVALVPGGFEDTTVMEFGKHRTALKGRTGFIKYALQHGYRVHPCYTFGETDTYHVPFTGALAFRFWLNKFQIPGAFLFVGCCPLLPFMPLTKPKLLTYVGKAIQLPTIANPSREDIETWHKVYCEALVCLFDTNKNDAGVSADLEIW